MKLSLQLYGNTYSAELDGEDICAIELKEVFERLMVMAGFPPSVITEEDGRWMWIPEEEVGEEIEEEVEEPLEDKD